MNVGQVIVDVIAMAAATVVAVLLIGAFARRVLGLRIGTVRILIAGVLGLGAEVGFESQFVWRTGSYSAALIPLQLAIILFVAIAFLVVAELVVPQGSIPRPDQWVAGARGTVARARRYSELMRIAMRHRLIPFKPALGTTSAAAAQRQSQARALKAALEDGKGAFVKLGQILSTRTDLLPAEFTGELATLQQRVPPAPWDEVRAVLEAELGVPIENVFRQIEHEPIAAASIGQVHLAMLPTGERVAVKVQRAGIVSLVERDVDITRRIARRLAESTTWARQLGITDLAESLVSGLVEELDFRIEASNIAAMEVTQARRDLADQVRIPHCVTSLSSRRVLVMEYLDGVTLSDAHAATGLTDADREALATRLLRSVLSQIMDDGVFHSDLHPGNVMITRDGNLALLDLGSVGRLDSELRRQITDLLLAFSRGDAAEFADALIAFIELPDTVDEFALRRQIGDFMSRFLGPGSSFDVSAFNQVVAVLSANGLAIPAELMVAFRAIATVEGTLRALTPRFDLTAAAADYARTRVEDAKRPAALGRAALDELAGLLPIVRRLPRRIDRITGELADGRLNVNVRLLADRRDRVILREFINLGAITFLAGVFGIMASMLLTSGGGPAITPTLSLYQLFGYLLVVVSGVLTLRVLFDVFRRRPGRG